MTFKDQADVFIQSSQARGRKPVRESTIKTYNFLLGTHVLPKIGLFNLQDVENGTLRLLVKQMRDQHLSASTINSTIGLVKMVVKSAVDARTGNQLHPRTWNNDFIDLPEIDPRTQKAPIIAKKALQQAISRAIPQNKALYALLAGAGLRIAEARSLQFGDALEGNRWDPATAVIKIRQAKTDAGIREIDLSPELNQFLIRNLPISSGQLFSDSYRTIRRKLKDAGIDLGMHAFRRFRVTHVSKVGVPSDLIRFWTGHAAGDVTERYVKIGKDIDARKEWAMKAGIGFELEAK